MPKQNRGPYILAAGAAAQLLTGIPAAWGVFQQPVMQGRPPATFSLAAMT